MGTSASLFFVHDDNVGGSFPADELVGMLGQANWPRTFAQASVTLDGLLDARAALAGVLEALSTELEGRFKAGLGTLPAEAQGLCDNHGYAHCDDRHKRMIKATAQYVVRAAPYAHASKLVKANVRRVLGLGPSFTTNLRWAGAWDDLQGGVDSCMRTIGRPLDDMFRKLDLERRLGCYDAQL
jgi:hypothetical protein